jgi:hypothetical protein
MTRFWIIISSTLVASDVLDLIDLQILERLTPRHRRLTPRLPRDRRPCALSSAPGPAARPLNSARGRLDAAAGLLLWLAMLTSTQARLLPLALGLALIPASLQASSYRDLCLSAPGACESILDTLAPPLNAVVCYSSKGSITLKGASECPSGSWAYYLESGEVTDPLTNTVAAYLPLESACNKPDLCLDGPPPPDAQEMPICCTSPSGTSGSGDETCVNWDGGTCDGSIWFCIDGVTNNDGTVTCFDAV